MHQQLRNEIEGAIPAHMQEGLIAYILTGRPPGGFLRAVLENDLYRSFAKADAVNQHMMLAYARVLEHMPIGSWGSAREVDHWIASGGLQNMNL